MGKFQIVMLLLKFGRRAAALLDFPGLESSDALRAWVVRVLDFLADAADQTATEADDAVVDALEKIVGNDAAWDGMYGIMSYLRDKPDEEIEVLGTSDTLNVFSDFDMPAAVAGISEKVGIDPLTIISLILMAFRFIRQFRQNRE